MNRLDQILEAWEEETLTAADLAELKQLLSTREGRAGLADAWLLEEAIYDALRARPEGVASAAPAPAAVQAPRRVVVSAPRRRLSGWLVWREVRLSIRWPLGFAAAACVLLAGLYYYFQKTAAGQLAAAEANVIVERAGHKQEVRAGQSLYPGDRLHVAGSGSAALAWAGESTRLDLAPGTDIELLNPMRGKRFWLKNGEVEASVSAQSSWRPLTITTPEAQAKVVGTRFMLAATGGVTRLEVFDGAIRLRRTLPAVAGGPKEVTVRGGETATAAKEIKLEVQSLTGLSVDVWEVPPGTALMDAATKGKPVDAEIPKGAGTVERLRGYVVATETGDFTFWVGSKGGAKAVELWLSPDDDPVHRRRVAHYQPPGLPVPAGAATTSPARSLQPDWHRSSTQQSTPQRLVAGRRYYLELWHEGTAMNIIGLGWKRPSDAASAEPSLIEHRSLFPLSTATAAGAKGGA